MKKIICIITAAVLSLGMLCVLADENENKGYFSGNPTLSENASFEEDEIVTDEAWVITATSSLGAGNSVLTACDGDLGTFWHSYYEVEDGSVSYKDNVPISFTVEFGKETEVSGFRYYPRAKEYSMSGIAKRATAYASDDGKSFYPVTGEVEFIYGFESQAKYERTPVEITFPQNIRARAVKIEFTESVSGYLVASEVRLLKPDAHKKTVTASEFNKKSDDYMLSAIDKKGVRATASSEQPYPFENQNDMDLTAVKTIDSNVFSTWHTQYRNEDGSTQGFNKKVMPAYLSYDFGSEYTLSAVGCVMRGGGFIGTHWVEAAISASDDGESFEECARYKFNPTQYKAFGRIMMYLPEAVITRYLRIDILSTIDDSGMVANSHAGANEIDFYETVNAQKLRMEQSGEQYTLTIGKSCIAVAKGTDYREKELDAAPFIAEGTTMIPLRGLFEEMGTTVSWSAEDKKITVKGGGETMVFQIENTRVYMGETRYSVAVAPRLYEGRTYIPLRFVSEHMGYNVSWDSDTETVIIEK